MTADIERVRSALSHLDFTDRDVWVKHAMSIKAEYGDDGFEIWDEWGSRHTGHNATSAKSVWKSVKAGGRTTIGSLFYDAKAAGWVDDKKYPKLSKEVIAQRQAITAQRQAEAEAEEAEVRELAAQHANFIWNQGVPLEGGDHDYLRRKGIKSYGLRVGPWEKIDPETGSVEVISECALLVPIWGDGREIHSLQGIFSGKALGGRDKDFVTGGAISGHYYAFGGKKARKINVDGEERRVLEIGEGYATLASAHEATGYASVVAFNAGNLPKVAREMRRKFPDDVIVILADNDQWHEAGKNPGVSKAREAALAVGGYLAVPPFRPADGKRGADGKMTGPTDFNDLHRLGGLDAVREVIEAAVTGSVAGMVEDTPLWEVEPTATLTPSPVGPADEAGNLWTDADTGVKEGAGRRWCRQWKARS